MVLSEDPPVASFPERLDRRLRLGPFPSARDALKFATYAGVGAVLVPVAGIGVGVGLAAVGFGFAVWRPDGASIDGRALAYLRWTTRWIGEVVRLTPTVPTSRVRGPCVRLEDGRIAAVVQAGGIPLAYLPPAELAHRFELYRGLLRSLEEPFTVTATSAPVLVAPVRPEPPRGATSDADARRGYGELVEVLARRRRVRRVYVTVTSADRGPEGLGRLESATSAVLDRLAALGLRPERLRGPALAGAARRLGWAVEGGFP